MIKYQYDSFKNLALSRSRDFGSPQCRLRLYVLGARYELLSPADFDAMVCYTRDFLRQVHTYTSIDNVVKWVSQLDVPHVKHGGLGTVKETWEFAFGMVHAFRVLENYWMAWTTQNCSLFLSEVFSS